MTHPPPSGNRRWQEGVALIIVLAFTVLVSTIVIAIFSRTMTMRQVAASSCQQAQAGELARSAMDILVGSLKQEIVNGSWEETSGTCTLYIATDSAYLSPQHNKNWSAALSSTIPSLVRVSSGTAATWPGVDLVLASAASTTATSANGKSISPTRWNRHYLVPRAKTSGSSIPTPVSLFPAPSWVYVTDQGPVQLTSPTNTAIGRYAYAIYNQSGLLDLNVAGYPSKAAPSVVAQKGVQAFADLTRLSTSLKADMVDNIVCWRNYATTQAQGADVRNLYCSTAGASAYCKAVLANRNGFLAVSGSLYNGGTLARSDQAFLSRFELLEFRRELQWDEDTLQHLGTFTRAVTAPSQFHSIRFATSGTMRRYHDDGLSESVMVSQGDQLLQSRFSLARLAWLTGTDSHTTEAIQACFGISFAVDLSGSFSMAYIGPEGTTPVAIKKLEEVAAEKVPRAPNFFELLKAGISNGTLTDGEVIATGSTIIAKYLANNGCYQSVGGLGYVFDDFWSAGYRYSPLLDLFSAVDEPPVAAGKIGLNQAHNMGLYALLMNAAADESSSSCLTSSSSALLAAYNFQIQLAAHPVRDHSELVSVLSGLGSSKQPALVALASVSNTRTWNLLIDVVAQAGVFPPTAKSLNRFTVQSERRYWLHLAIDRLTGQVVDRQIEPVYE